MMSHLHIDEEEACSGQSSYFKSHVHDTFRFHWRLCFCWSGL